MADIKKESLPEIEAQNPVEAEEIQTDEVKTEEVKEEVEVKATEKKASKTLSSFFHSARFKKGGLAIVFSLAFVLIIVLINIMFTLLENRFPSMQIDMTSNKIFSLSDDAVEAAKNVDLPTKIYILASEERAKDDSLLSGYGLQYSQVAVLAERAAEVNGNISVEYIDIERNPTFASAEKYAGYTLNTGSVIVENDRRIRVLGLTDLYAQETDYSTYSQKYYLQVDSALTNALTQVTVDSIPVVSVATGSHGEMLTDALSTFENLLSSNSFDIKTFDILTEEIPEDTAILILPTPTSDYTSEELAKLDIYLDSSVEGNRSLWVTFHATQPDLPNLSSFLSEWGLEVPAQQVIKENDTSHLVAPDYTYLISELTSNLSLGTSSDEDYGYFVTAQCRPINLLFTGRDSISTYALAQTYDTAYLESADGSTTNTSKPGVQTTVGMAVKMEKVGGVYYNKSVAAFGSSITFTSNYLSSTAFGNSKYLVDLARYATGTTDSSVGVMTKQIETNVNDISITTAARDIIGIGVFAIAIPLALILAGVIVYLKRRHL